MSTPTQYAVVVEFEDGTVAVNGPYASQLNAERAVPAVLAAASADFEVEGCYAQPMGHPVKH